MERTDEMRLIEALQTIAGAFIDEGMMDDLTRDISRLTDALERLSECVREDATGALYFNISPEVNDG